MCSVVPGCSVGSDSLWPHGPQPTRLLHRDSPGKNTRSCCHALLQGIFPTQGFNPCLLHCRWILYRLSHQRSPRILEWVAYPFSRESSRPRDWTGVFCTAGGFFTSWATTVPLKIPETDKLILKCTYKNKGPRKVKTILSKNELEGLIAADN